MKLHCCISAAVLPVLAASLEAAPIGIPPPPPGEWEFRRELAEEVGVRANESYELCDSYGLSGSLASVSNDLVRYFASATAATRKRLTLEKGVVAGRESYRVSVSPDGDVVLTAEDDDGIRRAAYYFEDRESAGDLRDAVRAPWLKNRISRCFFSPIKRPPFNRDELMDDVDYYPDAYLNRLAHEGVNGLWLTVELRNLVETSFNRRDKDAGRRLAKLRSTVEKCGRYGIRVWPFCIEPRRMEPGDPLLSTLPPDAHVPDPGSRNRLLCPSSPAAVRYIEEAFADLFRQVPGLPGVINITHGERQTSCLSHVSPVEDGQCPCPRCAARKPWELHGEIASAVLRGMRGVSPDAEFVSWFYHPQVRHDRASWVPEVARRLPEGVTMLYNFESGALEEQLGRYRPGGDYWLSHVGPSGAFEAVARAAAETGGALGAKIQVGCSHECATVPFVPVPGMLYRKYRAMRESKCATVMQCWYFGNYPGVMNKAAGELAFSDFSEGEDAFLLSLAKPEWRDSAADVARVWKRLSDAYSGYPLSNCMQYYGPFHAGVAWPLLPQISLEPLARTWKPHDPPSGDAIGECLENHTLAEASVLASRMAEGASLREADGSDALERLAERHAGDRERMRDVNVMRALRLMFESGADILEFYRLRERAVAASRFGHDAPGALAAIREMRRLVSREREISGEMAELCRADSRLGFHSEAETHLFHARSLEWRNSQLASALAELSSIEAEVAKGMPYPLSPHERNSPCVRDGETVCAKSGLEFSVKLLPDGDMRISGALPDGRDVILHLANACATDWPQRLVLSRSGCREMRHNTISRSAVVRRYGADKRGSGWSFDLVLDSRGWDGAEVRRPGWILFSRGRESLWPDGANAGEDRLNIGLFAPSQYGRIAAPGEAAAPVWPPQTRETKPWVYNWWMGSAVDEKGLEFQSRELAEKGFGGFHVIPIYGAKGYETKWKKYLSQEWMDAFALAKRVGARHGLGIDLTSGTGWCFGGPWLDKEEGGWKLVPGRDGQLAPQLTGQQVKRAAPGGEGPMMNPFSPGAMDSFLRGFAAFDRPGAALPEHFYHDSYEYFGAAWSPELPAAFKARRGYDIMEKWDVFSGRGDPDDVARVKCDYRQTLDDLMVEEVFPKWVEWCHAHGVKTRNEAHGSPANWLDLYALADVPETEMFGKECRDILVSKFASSAAHVMRRRHVAAESCTWIAEHFTETLAATKVFIDRLFLAGVNRVFFQGCAYSPVEAPWPGWCFYASMEMNPRNPIWRDVGALNAYVSRCQSVFQACEPDNDLLVYWPLRDYWWDAGGFEKMMSVHTGKDWFYGQSIGPFAKKLHEEGYSFDYVSDRMLANAEALGLGSRYAALAVPECRHMPEATRKAIDALRLGNASKARREPFAAAGLQYVRFRSGADTVYFVANQKEEAVSGEFAPSCGPKSAWRMDPLTGGIEPVSVEAGRVRLSLDAGHSCFLWCSPLAAAGAANAPREKTYLDLGEVIGDESVRVTVNGRFLGTLIMPPYRIEIPDGVLKSGRVEENDIGLDVCERAANRIRELDRNGVKWKTFGDINIVDIAYRPFDASKWPVMQHGVKGPVRIVRGRAD